MQENGEVVNDGTLRADAARAPGAGRSARLPQLLLLGVLAAIGCGDEGEPFDPNEDTATRIEILSDTVGLAGTAGRALAEPIRVRLTNWRGEPIAGAEPGCAPQSGGGCDVSPARTGEDGRAEVRWTLGPQAGTQRLQLGVVHESGTMYVATVTARANPSTP